ncbi:MAG TPA: metalloregulator ArsR/SmtB family transcription factor [Solirubrobacteraceae bacterium]|nr:metalloregulator ArsR/SmtB family transcription factor [Solirubrobacteraceae bacterium]
MRASSPASAPPAFVRLAAHPIRWQILTTLAHTDLRVSELCRRLGLQQNLTSYHLRQLRDEQLVSARRSSFDGRDVYYTLDPVRCRQLLDDSAAMLHPAFSRPPAANAATTERRPTSMLFLCTGNSARSQLAEAIARQLGGPAVSASSAGSHPKPIHANALRVMRDRGLPPHGLHSKHLDEFADQHFDHVITLCDRVREVCPEFPGKPNHPHWSIPDPSREGSTDRESYPAFTRTADELEHRIRALLAWIDRQPAAAAV